MNILVAVITLSHFFISAVCVGRIDVQKERGHAALREHIEVGKEEINVHKEKGHSALREHIEVGKEEFDVHKERGHASLREHIEIGKEEIKHTTGTVTIK